MSTRNTRTSPTEPLALAGVALVTASGLAIVWQDARTRRPAPVA